MLVTFVSSTSSLNNNLIIDGNEEDIGLSQLRRVNLAAEEYIASRMRSKTQEYPVKRPKMGAKKSSLHEIERYLRAQGVPGPDRTEESAWNDLAQTEQSQQNLRKLISFMFGKPRPDRKHSEQHPLELVHYEEVWRGPLYTSEYQS